MHNDYHTTDYHHCCSRARHHDNTLSASAPEFVRFLGRVLPNAVIGLLVIYSLKDSIGGVNHCIPELIALAFIFILHKWKKNTLLSIAGGTILYMFLVQIVF